MVVVTPVGAQRFDYGQAAAGLVVRGGAPRRRVLPIVVGHLDPQPATGAGAQPQRDPPGASGREDVAAGQGVGGQLGDEKDGVVDDIGRDRPFAQSDGNEGTGHRNGARSGSQIQGTVQPSGSVPSTRGVHDTRVYPRYYA